jgi:hypothetical protein
VHERRFPLFIGLRAFRILAVVPAWLLFVAALSLTVYLVGPDLPYGNALRLGGYVGLLLAMCLCISPCALLFAAGFIFRSLRRAFSARACDVALGREGIRILGGPAHGFSATWESLAMPGGVRWAPDGLWLRGGEKRWLHVPLPPDDDERASLEALFATVSAHAAASARKEAPPPRRTPPGTLLCNGCGAPQAPVEAPAVRCRHCNTTNAIPPELADKIRAMRAVAQQRAGDDALASAVVAQRGAVVANLVAFAGGLLMLGASAITLLATAAFAFVDGKEAGLPRGGGFGLAAAGVGLLLLAAVRFILANRRALRLLTVGFSAREPAREGDPPACRECSGPLPDPGAGAAVARCVYCGAANVMAADLRLEAAIVRRFAALSKDPHEVLAECGKQRRRARLVGALGLGMITGGALWLFREGRANALAGAGEAVEIPFDEEAKPEILGAVLPGPAAARVELVADLGDAPAWLVPDGHGGVTPVDPKNTLAKMPFSTAWYADTIVMDVAPLADGALLATMRASEEGHLRIRRIERDGATRVLLDDAREPMPSPDGKWLAAVRLVGEQFHVIVAPADRPDTPRQLTRGKGHEAFPVWSPDGKRIAFLTRTVRDPIQYGTRYGHGHLWVMDADGGHAERLTAGVSLEMVRPVWTEQGVWVLGRESTPRGGTTVLWRVVPR